MRVGIWLAVIMLCFGGSATAQATQTSGQSVAVPGWEAVGRLNISGRSMCTGALIAPDLVLTAAHCLYDVHTGRAVDARKIEFASGLNEGTAKAVRRVSRAIISDEYVHHKGKDVQIGADLALLVLETPISRNVVRPLATEKRPAQGDSVLIISYTKFSSGKQIVAQPCYILARKHDSVVTSCQVEFGASGAPVFAVQGGGQPRLVSVISSKAAMGNRQVSLGTVLDRALERLIARAG
ncbi:MAG: trypsin-like serine protease [Pseudomonadota bacterium]